MNSIKKLRHRVDDVDRSLLNLLSQRARLVKDIGVVKERNGQTVFVPGRERALLAELKAKNAGPLSDEAVESLFREIVHACRHLQKQLTVAYFGPEASFSHAAALKSFGRGAKLAPLRTISEVFAEVDKGRADFGVVPIENSTGGGVYHTLDMFIESPLSICAELELPVHHYLLGRSIRDLDQVKTLFTHYQALSQCRDWVDTHLPKARVVESTSTSEAAREAARTSQSVAIASKLAAEQYGLNVLASRIEDSAQNYTRFLVIGTAEPQPTGRDKTSIMFSIKDRPGALFDVLLPFKKHKLNLTKIESRPTRQKAWEYIFFVDFLGHRSEGRVQKALAGLERSCVFLKILGSYPRGE
jgi:chorismate mutase/prephenate dehydratase